MNSFYLFALFLLCYNHTFYDINNITIYYHIDDLVFTKNNYSYKLYSTRI